MRGLDPRIPVFLSDQQDMAGRVIQVTTRFALLPGHDALRVSCLRAAPPRDERGHDGSCIEAVSMCRPIHSDRTVVIPMTAPRQKELKQE
jgi:hypothetical protein